MNSPTGEGRNEHDTRRLGHDVAGEAYTASAGSTASDHPRRNERVSSRSTEDEARDLLSLRRAKRGDDAAFAELVSNNDAAVFALVSALTGTTQLDRLCTQVYLRAYRGLGVAPTARPRIWLLGIADGVARDAIRRVATGASARGQQLDPPIPIDRPADQRLAIAAVEGVGLTPRETARLVPDGLEAVRRFLESARQDPELTLPLPAPGEHDRGFWGDLGRRLLVERSAPAVSNRPDRGAPPVVSTPGSATTGTPETGRVARGMAERLAQQHPRRFPWRRVLTVGAVVFTVMVLVGVTYTVVDHATNRDAGLGETATKVLAKLDAALANDAVIEGSVRITSDRPDVLPSGRYRFARSNTGSWQLVADDGSVTEGYDVPSATFMTLRTTTESAPRATVRTGIAPGPPETTAVSDASIGDLLADSVRLVRSGSNGTATTRSVPTTTPQSTTTREQQWVVTSDLADHEPAARPMLAGTGALARLKVDRATLVADQSYALPVQVTLFRNDRTIATIRFTGLSISQQARTSSFVPEVPEGSQVNRRELGFAPTELAELNSGGSGPVPTPSYLPTGFVLTATSRNPTSRVTVLCYRNGSRQLVLTMRPGSSGDDAGKDPFARADRTTPGSHGVDIESGVMAGRRGQASEDPIAHVWVSGSQTEVVAAGDPSTDQLVEVIASLR